MSATTAAPSVEEPRVASSVTWETSEEVARARAKDRGAPMLVFMCADWATPVARMDRTTWTDARVVELARSFVLLRLDLSNADPNAEASAARYELRTMPSVVLLGENGREAARLEGYAGPEEVVAAMRAVMPGN
ncbi:MAG: thioredoxin family protein [Polyangiaceae bacterium]